MALHPPLFRPSRAVWPLSLALLGCLAATATPLAAAQESRLMTRWGAELDPAQVHPEHPRPQLRRPDWLSLNGEWQYAIQPALEPQPESWQGQILVPFPVESALSGVQRRVQPEQVLWYRRSFEVPQEWNGRALLLHFGAVDWQATVSVAGRPVGRHRGGSAPFPLGVTGSQMSSA